MMNIRNLINVYGINNVKVFIRYSHKPFGFGSINEYDHNSDNLMECSLHRPKNSYKIDLVPSSPISGLQYRFYPTDFDKLVDSEIFKVYVRDIDGYTRKY